MYQQKQRQYLAWDLSAIEGGVLGNIELVVRHSMDVYGVEPLVITEELIPERRERERPARHEEEGDLRHPLERKLFGLGHEGGPPEELVVGHGVREAWRVDEGPEREPHPAVPVPRVAAVGGGREEELGVGRVVVVARDAAADGEAQHDAAHEDDGGGDELEEPRRPPAVLARGRREVVGLVVPGCG